MKKVLEALCIFIVFVVVIVVNSSNFVSPTKLQNEDIFVEYNQSVGIAQGINPYEKILSGNLLDNNKYATLLPSYYYFLLIVAWFSNFSFSSFVANYRFVLLIFEFIGFIFLYKQFKGKNLVLVGIFAAAFFLLNRWTLNNISLLKQDLIAISLLLVSLYYLDRRTRLAYLFYGISLAIKHLGILIFPLYLAPLVFGQRKIKDFFIDILVMISPIFFTSIVFVVWNLKAFVLSMLFSATRKADSTSGVVFTGYENLLANNIGKSFVSLLSPRLPLLIFSVFNIFLFYTKKISGYLYIFLTFAIFLALNPVYFDQYITWITPFVALTVLEYPYESQRL